MLGHIGAWRWYNDQIELALQTQVTKKGKPVGRKGAATLVLDRMVGRVILERDESHISSIPADRSKAGIVEENLKSKRGRIKMQLSRGNKLSKLVGELGTGILFSRDIW
jgi:hypothetical protein